MPKYINCTFKQDNPESFKEVTLEELLNYDEYASLTCDSEDGVWQYYYICKPGEEYFFVKIKKATVLEYLDSKEEQK